MGEATRVDVGGHQVRLSNLDKVLYPQAGWTKAHIIDYYTRVSPVLLPHLEGRALTLKRYPDGVEGGHFYEKRCPPHRPDFVRTAPIWSKGKQDYIEFCVVDDLATLVWAANLADLEMHTYLAKAHAPEAPTMLVFDLDPGPGVDILDCCDVALWLRDALDAVHLRSLVKTSGSKGMQLYVPLNTPASFEDTKPFARAMGEVVERDHEDKVVTNMSKALRKDKVLIDWSQNDAHKTTVCAYSLRAKARPTVSTPLAWAEVEAVAKSRDADALRFEAADALARVETRGDLFSDVLTMAQALPVLE